jgi:hypothetical protein
MQRSWPAWRAGLLALATMRLIAACGVAPSIGGVPGGFGDRREEAVLVGSFGEVHALSGGRRMLFAASSDGLAIFDRLAGRWLAPLGPREGYPATTLTTVSADPELDAVWMGGLGEVVFFHPGFDQLSRAIVPGRVDRIVFDRDAPAAGAYVASGGVWTRISPGGSAFPVRFEDVPPTERQWRSADLDDLVRQHPTLRSFAGLLTRDQSLRSWQLTAGTTLGDRSDLWLGTLGGGLYRVDPLFNRAEHVPYGLFERGASALALAANGVLIGSEARDARGTGGVTTADRELQRWAWLRGSSDGSMSGARVNDILVRDGVLWIATSLGVARLEIGTAVDAGGAAGSAGRGAGWRWAMRGLDRRAAALAPSPRGVWAGTDLGVIELRVDGPEPAGTPLGGSAVAALVRSGDSLWVGTSAGLTVAHTANGAALQRPVLSGSSSVLDRRVRALALADSVLVVATDDAVSLVDLRARAVRTLPAGVDPRIVAPINVVAIDAEAIWIGGERGLLVVDRTSGGGRVIVEAVAGVPINDVVLDASLVWLATPAGVLRLRKDALTLPARR